MRGILAAPPEEWYQQRAEIVKNELPEDGRLKQIYGRGHYGKWYQMITEYTRREITKETDRLPALAGLAQAWVQRYPEIYACGLWNEDLAVGLLWTGSSFYAPYGGMELQATCINQRRELHHLGHGSVSMDPLSILSGS